jgi:hypothetical protein
MGFWHHADSLVTPGHRISRSRLTATVTATAATNGKQQRPSAAHDTRTIRATLGYVRPEKQTVGDQRQGAVTVANTVAKPPYNACPRRTDLECRPSTRTMTDGPGRCAHSYGSEGCGSIYSAGACSGRVSASTVWRASRQVARMLHVARVSGWSAPRTRSRSASVCSSSLIASAVRPASR